MSRLENTRSSSVESCDVKTSLIKTRPIEGKDQFVTRLIFRDNYRVIGSNFPVNSCKFMVSIKKSAIYQQSRVLPEPLLCPMFPFGVPTLQKGTFLQYLVNLKKARISPIPRNSKHLREPMKIRLFAE